MNIYRAIGLLLVMAGAMFAQTAGRVSAPELNKPRPRPLNLAIFLFDRVQIIDYTGPFEVFGQAYDTETKQSLFNVYTVAEKPDAITTNMGMTVVPKYSFANAPRPDIILLPGGDVREPLKRDAVVKWVQDRASEAEFVMSVCNGAFYLARAGLLDGKNATTYYGLIDQLKKEAPRANIVSDKRFTDNGKIITTAGLSSGIDGALHLIERIAGHAEAQRVALNMEYNWQPDSGYARASFADRHLRKIISRSDDFKLPEGAIQRIVAQRGDRDSWEKQWEIRSSLTAGDLLKLVDARLGQGWKKQSRNGAHESLTTVWKFDDEEGKPWSAVSYIQPGATKDTLLLTIRLARGEGVAGRL